MAGCVLRFLKVLSVDNTVHQSMTVIDNSRLGSAILQISSESNANGSPKSSATASQVKFLHKDIQVHYQWLVQQDLLLRLYVMTLSHLYLHGLLCRRVYGDLCWVVSCILWSPHN
ncbi:hypothetical protein NE237_016341 [Protea cynaroides]|uniref:Uncharacterized protein n=1 Tax=Protea cynaroides TaxID=273540 RepID=A0A9Q0GNK6_9MAGN|nr:hypothetical protein NE237_016341 [Protea cynaroides]